MKKRIAFFLLISVLLTVSASAAVPTSVSASEVSAKAGETVVIDVRIAGNPGLAAWLVELEWDSAALEPDAEQISVGTAFRSGSFLSAKTDDGTLRLIWFSTKDVCTDGVLFSVPFRVKTGVGGVYPIRVTCPPENTVNSDEETVPVTVRSGSITVPDGGKTPSDTAAVSPYTDVSETDYFYPSVLWAAENGVTSGTTATTFSPAAGCTRAQTVTFLWRAAGSPAPKTGKNPFADVSADAYYCEAVLWAAENGITSGTSASAFSPDAPVTRAQAVTFLRRSDAGAHVQSTAAFSDVAPDAYYAEAVSWAVQRGVTNGVSDTAFGPEQPCTRAQIVTFLYRYHTA